MSGGADERFMRMALTQARRALRAGEVPVGAVVVAGDGSGEVLGRGHNLVVTRNDPTAHAEVVALRRAARRAGNYRLTGTTLYATLEPCLLCLGAIVQARVGRVVWAADDPKRGAMGAARIRRVASLLHHEFEARSGVLAEDGGMLLRDFFKPRRLAPSRRGC